MNKKIYLLTAIGFISSSSVYAQQNIGEFLAKNPEVKNLCSEYKKKTYRDTSSASSSRKENASSMNAGGSYAGYGATYGQQNKNSTSSSQANQNILSDDWYEKNCDNVLAYFEKEGRRYHEREILKAKMREKREKYKIDAERENNKYKHDEARESISSNERINLYKIQTDYSVVNNTNATNYLIMDRQLQTEELKDVRRESVIRDFNKQDEIRDNLKKQRKY